MTVTWSGGNPGGKVQIFVIAATDNALSNVVQAFCAASSGPGTFTIPPYVMLALPATNFAGFTLAPADTSVPLSAPGLDLGLLQTHNDGAGFGLSAATGAFALK